MLVKLGLLLKDKLSAENKLTATLNKKLDTSGANESQFANLLKYMDIKENDLGHNLDKKLNEKAQEAKSVKKLFGKKGRNTNALPNSNKLSFPVMQSSKDMSIFKS